MPFFKTMPSMKRASHDSCGSTAFFQPTWPDSVANRHLMDRRLANVLTIARAYTDHSMEDISRIYGMMWHSFAKDLKKQSKAYDTALGYEVMENIRNHLWPGVQRDR